MLYPAELTSVMSNFRAGNILHNCDHTFADLWHRIKNCTEKRLERVLWFLMGGASKSSQGRSVKRFSTAPLQLHSAVAAPSTLRHGTCEQFVNDYANLTALIRNAKKPSLKARGLGRLGYRLVLRQLWQSTNDTHMLQNTTSVAKN